MNEIFQSTTFLVVFGIITLIAAIFGVWAAHQPAKWKPVARPPAYRPPADYHPGYPPPPGSAPVIKPNKQPTMQNTEHKITK
jgi:hypothetical protein